AVTLDGLYERPGFNLIEFGQVRIQHDVFAPDHVDMGGDAFNRDDAALFGPWHPGTVPKGGRPVNSPQPGTVSPRRRSRINAEILSRGGLPLDASFQILPDPDLHSPACRKTGPDGFKGLPAPRSLRDPALTR